MGSSKPPVAFSSSKTGPLNGVRVLDLSRLVAGNMTSMQLGDFGADVIKIEPPKGDPLRAWKDEDLALFWKVYGRNKRSIVLNLRHQPAKNALWKLIETADVFIENYRPGTLEKMGFAPSELLKRNKNLVILRVSGFGQTGPYAQRPGFGTIVEGMSGYADRTGFPEREPVLPPLALADMIAGLYGASAVSMALLAREKNQTGGQVIDLSLLEPIFSILGPESAIFQLTGKVKQRAGSASNTSSPRNVYRCADGKYLALSGSTQNMALRIFSTIGRPDLVDDPRFALNSDRVKNRDLVDEIVGNWFSQHASDEALEIMQNAEVTVGPIYSMADAAVDTHFIDREVFVDVEDEEFGAISMHNILPRLSKTPGGFFRPAPTLGADTDTILSEVGLTNSDIAKVKEGNYE